MSFALSVPGDGLGAGRHDQLHPDQPGRRRRLGLRRGLTLSDNGAIPSTGTLLDALHFDGLAAGASTSGTETVTLPQADARLAPPGFGALSDAYVGFLIDPNNSRTGAKHRQRQQPGAGIDLAVLAAAAQPVAGHPGSGVQQDPSIAVDPTNPSTSSSPTWTIRCSHTGYAGIGVAVSTDGGATWTTSVDSAAGRVQPGGGGPDRGLSTARERLRRVHGGDLPRAANPDLTYPGMQPAGRRLRVEQRHLRGRKHRRRHLGQPASGLVSDTFTDGRGRRGRVTGGTDVPFDGFPDLAVRPPNGQAIRLLRPSLRDLDPYYPPTQFPGDPNSTDGSAVMFAISSDGGATGRRRCRMSRRREGYYEFPASNGAGTGLVSAVQDPLQGNNDGGPPAKALTILFGHRRAGGAVYLAMYAGGYFTVFPSRTAASAPGAAGSQVSGFTAPNLFPDWLRLRQRQRPRRHRQLLSPDDFRTLPLREIVADPTRPGVVYAVGANAARPGRPNGAIDASGIVVRRLGRLRPDLGQQFHRRRRVLAPGDRAGRADLELRPGPQRRQRRPYPGYAASPQGQSRRRPGHAAAHRQRPGRRDRDLVRHPQRPVGPRPRSVGHGQHRPAASTSAPISRSPTRRSTPTPAPSCRPATRPVPTPRTSTWAIRSAWLHEHAPPMRSGPIPATADSRISTSDSFA